MARFLDRNLGRVPAVVAAVSEVVLAAVDKVVGAKVGVRSEEAEDRDSTRAIRISFRAALKMWTGRS